MHVLLDSTHEETIVSSDFRVFLSCFLKKKKTFFTETERRRLVFLPMSEYELTS